MSSAEPVMSTYMAKWAKVDLVAHEQERIAREEYSRDCISWQRMYITRIDTENERLRGVCEEAADMLESAQSGYIAGCGPDERWKRERDNLVTRLRASK